MQPCYEIFEGNKFLAAWMAGNLAGALNGIALNPASAIKYVAWVLGCTVGGRLTPRSTPPSPTTFPPPTNQTKPKQVPDLGPGRRLLLAHRAAHVAGRRHPPLPQGHEPDHPPRPDLRCVVA